MKKLSILVLLVSFLVAGCGPRVQTENLTGQDLRSAYETFAYLPNSSVDENGQVVEDPVVNQSIIEAINDNMQGLGFTLDREEPDLLVLVSMETQTETRTTTRPSFATFPYHTGIGQIHPVYRQYYYVGFHDWYGPSPFFGYDAHTRDYRKGTMIIYLVDRETQRTVWKGTASKAIGSTTPDAAADLINAMFEEFP